MVQKWTRRLTTADLIRAVQTVSLPVTQELLRDAAKAIGATMLAALGLFSAVQLIGLVATLRPPVTHLRLRDAHLPVRAPKLA